MTQIDTHGMEVAELTEEQLQVLAEAEQQMNQGEDKEIHLLAVQR